MKFGRMFALLEDLAIRSNQLLWKLLGSCEGVPENHGPARVMTLQNDIQSTHNISQTQLMGLAYMPPHRPPGTTRGLERRQSESAVLLVMSGNSSSVFSESEVQFDYFRHHPVVFSVSSFSLTRFY